MENEEIIRLRQANFRQTNAYAMQHGIMLGLWAVGCQACYVAGLSHPLFSNLWMLMLIGIPALTCIFTLRLRRIAGNDRPFPFSRGFVHAFLTLLYTAVWAAVATFVYMQFFDNGYVFDCYTATLSRPEMVELMNQSGMSETIKASTNGHTMIDVVNELRNFGAANFAALIIYFYILSSPFISILAGLVSMRRNNYLQTPKQT